MTPAIDPAPDDIEALRAALVHERAALATEQLARREAEARASGAEAMVAHLKLLIAQLKHDRFGASSERGRKLLDQLELQLEEAQAAVAEDEAALDPEMEGLPARKPVRRKPVRGPLPAHLPRERVVIPGPTSCPCCQGKLSKLGEDVTETLEVVPPALESGADRARAHGVPGVRHHQPAAGAVPSHREAIPRSDVSEADRRTRARRA